MTEAQVNPSPQHLVKVTHPKGRTEQVRLDVPEGGDPLEAARQWLADGRNDPFWLEADAELLEPDPVADADGDQPEPEPAPAGDGLQPPPAWS